MVPDRRAKPFKYKVGQAVAGLLSPGPALANGTVTAVDPPRPDGYRYVHVEFTGTEKASRSYLVSASGASDYLLPYPMRPTVNDDRVNPDERYRVTREGDGAFVANFDGDPIGTADTEAAGWDIALLHDYNTRKFREVGRRAFLAGEPAPPSLNYEVREAIDGMKVGDGAVHIFRAFQEGWTAAALVEERVHFASPVNEGFTACGKGPKPGVRRAVLDDPRVVTCQACRDTEDFTAAWDMADFADSLPEATDTEQDKIVILREVVEKFAARKIEGVVIDPQTANAIVTVYDAMKQSATREKFLAMPVVMMGQFAWRLVGNSRKGT